MYYQYYQCYQYYQYFKLNNKYIIILENESLQVMVASKNERVEELQSMLEMKEERMKELESIQERNHVLHCS